MIFDDVKHFCEYKYWWINVDLYVYRMYKLLNAFVKYMYTYNTFWHIDVRNKHILLFVANEMNIQETTPNKLVDKTYYSTDDMHNYKENII